MNKHGVGISNILSSAKEGEDITTFDVKYFDTFKQKLKYPDQPEVPNAMFIVYKDKNHTKHIQMIPNPKMKIYFVNPEERTFRTPREYLEIDKCYSVNVYPKQVLSTIAKEVMKSDDPVSKSTMEMYKYAQASSIKTAKKEILKWPYTLFSDVDIEMYYHIMLGYHYNQMRSHIIDKCFLDIESDIYGLTTTEQQLNLDPTNACTLIFRFDPNGPRGNMKSKVFTFLLRNHKKYPQQKYFEDHIDEFIEECHDKFDRQQVIKGGKEKWIDVPADYQITLFDSESELLTAIFDCLNKYRPDTCEIWNIAYDIPKLYARMEHNGINPVHAMCDPMWPEEYRYVDIHIDNRPIDVAERKTSIRMGSTITFIDQMQNYAGIRKGRKAYGSNSLDNIANIELGVGKWTFRPGVNVINACVEDYWNFVLYNIRDVWCQTLIDEVTNDTMATVYNMNQSFCPLRSIFKQITYQRQIYYTQRLNRGFLSGNNPNVDYLRGETEEFLEHLADLEQARQQRAELDEAYGEYSEDTEEESDEEVTEETEEEFISKEDEVAKGIMETEHFDPYWDDPTRDLKLMGGMVGDPDNNIPNGTELIEGIKSKHIVDDVLDMDFASEYPWAKVTRSLSKSTQFGRLIIPERISKRQNCLPLGQQKRQEDQKYYTSGSEFTSDYISGDVISLGNVWFNLPTVVEMQKKLRETVGYET